MEWSKKHVVEWKEARRKKLGCTSSNCRAPRSIAAKWKAPVVGKFKVNVDASVYPGTGSCAVEMIIRDHTGEFVQARNLRRAGEVPVFEAEAWGVLEALTWVQSLQLQNVEFESDSLLTVSALQKEISYLYEVGFILKESTSILRERPDFSVSFVKKHANKAAHVVARVPCLIGSSNVFLSPPPSVLETLLYDSSVLQ